MSKSETNRRSQSESLIDRLISTVETKLDSSGTKISVADYIRLLQMKKELEDDELPQKVEVRWVESEEEAGSLPEESVHKT
jgi:hypothetical protein